MDPNRLKEFGLLPVWRVRPGALSGHPADQSVAASPVPPSGEPIAELPDQSPIPAENLQTGDRAEGIARADWQQLRQMVSSCIACPLSQARTQSVFGVGDELADWLFIGEGPGAREDELGEPFVGQAGILLDNMLQAISLRRGENVYIANIVKCRPPENRNPQDAEAEQCRPYLLRQIALIQPRLIVALGKVAAQNLLATDDSIASLRGRLHTFSGIPLIVTYHPAYLLRSLADKAKAWEDLCFARTTMQHLLLDQGGNLD